MEKINTFDEFWGQMDNLDILCLLSVVNIKFLGQMVDNLDILYLLSVVNIESLLIKPLFMYVGHIFIKRFIGNPLSCTNIVYNLYK